MDVVTSQLVAEQARLMGYIRSKVPDPETAEDILQDSLLLALRAAPNLRDEARVVPWFHQIVRNAVADFYRRRYAEAKHVDAYAEPEGLALTAEDEAVLCACFRELLPTLKPEYAVLVERLELTGEDPARVAEDLGLTRNNLKVRRHRARQQLRLRLEETCRVCARHGCLDCTCRSM